MPPISSAAFAAYRKQWRAAQEFDERGTLIEQRVGMYSEPEAFGFGHVDNPVPPARLWTRVDLGDRAPGQMDERAPAPQPCLVSDPRPLPGGRSALCPNPSPAHPRLGAAGSSQRLVRGGGPPAARFAAGSSYGLYVVLETGPEVRERTSRPTAQEDTAAVEPGLAVGTVDSPARRQLAKCCNHGEPGSATTINPLPSSPRLPQSQKLLWVPITGGSPALLPK